MQKEQGESSHVLSSCFLMKQHLPVLLKSKTPF